MIYIVKAGRWTTIQDRGRPGLEQFGIPPGGAADWYAAAVANRLVGNHRDAALLECTSIGPALRFGAEAEVAVTGGDCASTATWETQSIASGQTLEIGSISPGLRAYVAVRGGIEVSPLLGSRSFCQRGAFGGGFGRPLAVDDRMRIGGMSEVAPLADAWPVSHRLPMRGPWEVPVIAGPHLDAFDRDALTRLTDTACRVTPEIDRMGLRLETPGLRLHAAEILTTPLTAGAIQVTPSGGLIVLLVDHQTTGGYPVVATATAAHLPQLAQARPGETIHFRQVDLPEAARAFRRLTGWLEPSP